jgi:hypothetical protein
MKWFFLALLVLIAFGGAMLIVKGTPHWLSYDRLAAAVVVALFCLALFAYWRASYFLEGARQDQVSEFAHSIFLLSIGAFCIWLGGDIVISDACADPLPAGGTTGIQWADQLAGVTAYLQERGWCAALGYSFLLLGGAFSWPTLKLLFGAFIKKPRYPPL